MLVSHPLPQTHKPLAVLAAMFVASCGGGGGGGDAAAPATTTSAAFVPARAVQQTDLDIASAIYSGKRAPDDFYAEPVPSGYEVVATVHLKNTDLDPSLADSQPQFELCTDDWNQALGWSETSAQNAQHYADLVATNDDTRFFEFARMRNGSPNVYTQARIYKCAYVDRTSADLRANTGDAGRLNVRPVDAKELQRFSEYVYRFTTYNNFGHSVLQSSSASNGALEHTLHIASLVRGGMSATCDRIDVLAWRHRVDAATGDVTLDVQTLWSFGARESAGAPQLCAN